MISWILSDHQKVGTQNQCHGIAHALGLTPDFIRMNPRYPWRLLPPTLWFQPLKAQSPKAVPLIPTEQSWPSLLIAAGRASAAPAAAIRKQSLNLEKKCFTIFLQNPCLSLNYFDCVIAPLHDHLTGPNVISILGSLNAFTDKKINAAVSLYRCRPNSPITTVLVGGDSRHYQYTEEDMKALAQSLQKIRGHHLITTSRRTRRNLIDVLKANLDGVSYDMWDGTGENPYLAYLGLADRFIVSGESISMASEACYRGKPTYIWNLPFHHRKHLEFHRDLYAGNYARPLEFPLPLYDSKKLNEAARVAPIVRKMIDPFS